MTWIGWVVVVALVIVVPVIIAMVFASGRNMYGGPGVGAGMFGGFVEAFSPTRYEAGRELEAQKQRRADVATPSGTALDAVDDPVDDLGDEPAGTRSDAVDRPPTIPLGLSDDPRHSSASAPPPGWLDGSQRPGR